MTDKDKALYQRENNSHLSIVDESKVKEVIGSGIKLRSSGTKEPLRKIEKNTVVNTLEGLGKP